MKTLKNSFGRISVDEKTAEALLSAGWTEVVEEKKEVEKTPAKKTHTRRTSTRKTSTTKED